MLSGFGAVVSHSPMCSPEALNPLIMLATVGGRVAADSRIMHAEGEMITERSHSYVPRLRRRSDAASKWQSMASALVVQMARADRLGETTATTACQVGDFVGHG